MPLHLASISLSARAVFQSYPCLLIARGLFTLFENCFSSAPVSHLYARRRGLKMARYTAKAKQLNCPPGFGKPARASWEACSNTALHNTALPVRQFRHPHTLAVGTGEMREKEKKGSCSVRIIGPAASPSSMDQDQYAACRYCCPVVTEHFCSWFRLLLMMNDLGSLRGSPTSTTHPSLVTGQLGSLAASWYYQVDWGQRSAKPSATHLQRRPTIGPSTRHRATLILPNPYGSLAIQEPEKQRWLAVV